MPFRWETCLIFFCMKHITHHKFRKFCLISSNIFFSLGVNIYFPALLPHPESWIFGHKREKCNMKVNWKTLCRFSSSDFRVSWFLAGFMLTSACCGLLRLFSTTFSDLIKLEYGCQYKTVDHLCWPREWW